MSVRTTTQRVCDGCDAVLNLSNVRLSVHDTGKRRHKHFDFCGPSCIQKFLDGGRFPVVQRTGPP